MLQLLLCYQSVCGRLPYYSRRVVTLDKQLDEKTNITKKEKTEK